MYFLSLPDGCMFGSGSVCVWVSLRCVWRRSIGFRIFGPLLLCFRYFTAISCLLSYLGIQQDPVHAIYNRTTELLFGMSPPRYCLIHNTAFLRSPICAKLGGGGERSLHPFHPLSLSLPFFPSLFSFEWMCVRELGFLFHFGAFIYVADEERVSASYRTKRKFHIQNKIHASSTSHHVTITDCIFQYMFKIMTKINRLRPNDCRVFYAIFLLSFFI